MESGSVTIKLLDRKEQTTLPVDELVSYLDVHLEEEEEHHHHHEEE